MKHLKHIAIVMSVSAFVLVVFTVLGTYVDGAFLEPTAPNLFERLWLTDVLRFVFAVFCAVFAAKMIRSALVAMCICVLVVLFAEMPAHLLGFQPFFSGLSRLHEGVARTLLLLVATGAVCFWWGAKSKYAKRV
jgi:hypothetical protein